MEVIKANLFHLELQPSSSTHLPNYHMFVTEAAVHYTMLKWTYHAVTNKSWTKKSNEQQLFSFPISVQAIRTAVTDTSLSFSFSLY